jgi:dTDP-4-amino-4,6-dideoxygalactose transaminase
MRVAFNDLYAHHQPLEEELVAAFRDVLRRSAFILGGSVEKFEKSFAEYCGTQFCCGVSSGLDALSLAITACGIGPRDEVITAADTYIATTLAISRCGARPVLVDCDPVSYNIDIDQIGAAITPATKAILPVHLYGQAADMDAIQSIADRHGLVVIEDAAQAHGATYKGRKCGSMGAIGCFSFYPGKNLGALGDGGAIVTDDEALHDKLLRLRNYGSLKKYYHEVKGGNNRLDAIQAEFLDIKLKKLDEWNEARKHVADRYCSEIDGVKYGLPETSPGRTHIYHLFILRTADRDAVINGLKKADIDFGIHYPLPIHLQEAYSDLDKQKGSYPITEKLSDEIISLPMHPFIAEDEITRVVEALNGLDVECVSDG